jgi:hypothetical protein
MKTAHLNEISDTGSSYVLRAEIWSQGQYLRDAEVVITHEAGITKSIATRILSVLYPNHGTRNVTVEVL